jgi:TP901 family phage tail tape measure protein
MAANNVNIKLGADVKDFTSKMKIVARQFKRTARNLKRTGKTLTRNLTGPIAALGTGAVMAAANFQKSMNKVRAITGATGKDFKKLDAQAKQLGKNTQFSASQAADAMSFLGMAGFKTEEIMSAMPATLDLAAAGSMDLAQAADIASNVISGFGAEASDLGKFSDVMAKAMTSSNTSLEQLGGAMKMVAPVSKGFGISMEETTAAIGKLSDAGIQGESAGTGLRGILATLSEKAGQLGMNVFDAAGNMRPLNEILTEIEGKGHSTATIMEVFGKKAGPSMLALLNVGGEGLKNFTTELENSGGTAKRIADTQMEGLAGSLTRLKSATEGLAISFGEIIIPVIEKLVSFIQNLITAWTNLDEGLKIAIVTLGAIIASIGPLITLFGTLASVVGFFLSPLGIAIAALAALSAAFIYVSDNLEGVKERFTNVTWWKNTLISMLQFFVDFAADVIGGYNKMLLFFKMTPVTNPFIAMSEGLEELKDNTVEYEHELGTFGEAVSAAALKAKEALTGLGSGLGLGTGGGSGGSSGGGSGGSSGGGEGGGDSGGSGGGGGSDPITAMTEKMQALKNITQSLGNALSENLASGFANAVTSGQNFGASMVEIFKNIAKQIATMIIKAMVLAALFTYLGIGDAKGMTQSAGFFKNFSTSLTGKAGGGSVIAGQPFLVGERGPEMFMPGQSGTIIPNQNIGGSVIPDVRISGDDLLIIFDKAQRRKERR